MSTYTRPVMLLLCGLLLLTLAIAVLNTLVPLWLAHENLPTWQVGVVSSSYFTGNLVGTLLTGYLIKHLGFNRSYYIASLIFAAGCVGLGIMVGFWSWMTWRFIAGVGCAMIWVVVESALMCSGTSRNRGRLLAAYMMIYYVGTFLGQLLVSKVSTELMNVLPWVTGTILAGVLPLLFTRIANQQGDEQQLSLDQILIPCAIRSLAARKPSSLLCRASQPSQRAPQLAIPVRLLSIKPPSLAIAM
ncbi:hypothetical protein STN0717CIT72_17180 [Citrobacter portucalensis]|nr:hypothetical protein STN0717CIT72_17180 [Citrobacter portucalensis]